MALMIGGVSAASHAMENEGHFSSSDYNAGSDIDVSDKGKVEKSGCSDCLHNCSLLILLSDNKAELPLFTSSAKHGMEKPEFLPDPQVLSLLRPPQTLA